MAFCPSLPEGDHDVYGVHSSSKSERNAPHTPSRQSHSYDLSSACKVSVKTDSNDKKSIDIREYIHDKWGGQNPSKDGVCLSIEEYVKVKSLVKTVDMELEKTDGDVSWHPLSGEHILRVGTFVNGDVKTSGVDLRAMKKSKNGEMKPTGKGITLSPEKWNIFKDAMSKMEENEELGV
eukprot:Seg775.7 transcript_id=Seg775.7/GoldUCD/mRNA.D3Y31 product="hypothetical protein" protein_id=Seg775.7/GoldUCD/D3Y31